ncbi:hypothetical protein ACFQYP_31895 [Nonomuraea antimicrobica]
MSEVHREPDTGASVGGPVTVYVPCDSAARSVGADQVAERIAEAAGPRARVVRNGSRGMLWLEPLVEVATPAGRVAYGPVTPHDVDDLLDAGLLDGAAHPLCLGPTEEIAWLRDQTRVTFARVGVIDPVSLDDYAAHGGLAGLRRALSLTPEQVVAEVTDSGLRGRGGAGFPAGIKWKTVLGAESELKFVCCNADEGDSGTFADRMLMEGDPFTLIEGMTIAAWAVGASEGYVYIRSEYPDAVAAMRTAIDVAYARGWLGKRVLDHDFSFDLFVRVGGGAYICGEETSMLESLEGKRGMVRAKPPIPALEGLFGKPTVVNNVLTLGSVPMILADGAQAFADLGTAARAAPRSSSSAATSPAAASWRPRSASPSASWWRATAAAPARAGRCGPYRSAGRSAPTCRRPGSSCPWTTRRSPRRARWWVTAAWWCSTTPWTWRGRPGSPWSSVPPSRAASARRAGSARCAGSRSSTGSSRARTAAPT